MKRTVRRSLTILMVATLSASALEIAALGQKKPKRRARARVSKRTTVRQSATMPLILLAVTPTPVTPQSEGPTSKETTTTKPAKPTPKVATAGQLIISEFRLRGPGLPSSPGSAPFDEFIEIYNASGAPHTVAAASGTGYGIAASDGGTRCSIPNGTVILDKGHFLCQNSAGFSLTNYFAGNLQIGSGDATYTTDIPDNAGIALFNNNSGGASYSLANRLDAAGSTSEANTLYREGAGYPPLSGAAYTNGIDYVFYRDTCGKGGVVSNLVACTLNGLPKDSDNNSADFIFVDTQATNAGAGQRLGSPGPETMFSPLQRNSGFTLDSLDPCVDKSASPNRVRDSTPDAANNSTFGTLSIRRTITNNTAAGITRLRFRIVDMTTSQVGAGIADLRARTSADIMVTVDRSPCGAGTSSIPVLGTELEDRFLFMGPPFQPAGGGLHAALKGQVSLLQSIPPGGSMDLHFLLGVQQPGLFRFYLNIEVLP